MAFKKQDPVTRNPHIESLEIRLYRTVNEDDPEYPESIEYSLTINDQFDDTMVRRLHNDLVPHLTAKLKADLQSFMDWVWAKAEEEVIG